LQDRLDLFLNDEDLERILNKALHGLVLNQPLRTRSKALKSTRSYRFLCQGISSDRPKTSQTRRLTLHSIASVTCAGFRILRTSSTILRELAKSGSGNFATYCVIKRRRPAYSLLWNAAS